MAMPVAVLRLRLHIEKHAASDEPGNGACSGKVRLAVGESPSLFCEYDAFRGGGVPEELEEIVAEADQRPFPANVGQATQ